MTSLLNAILDLFHSNKDNPVLVPELTEADMRGIVQRFLAPKGESVNAEGRYGKGQGFGEIAWVEKVIADDPALATKPKEDAIAELMTYQGLHAIAAHRVAHELYEKGETVAARQLSQAARRLTAGIEIHPGATIGSGFFIDHGAGVVIGETARIGDNVMLYHSVTLGNDGKQYDYDYRHPQLGNDVVLNTNVSVLGPVRIEDGVHIGSGAKVIGDIKIGKNSTVAPGLVVRQTIPDGVRAVHQNGAGDILVKVPYITKEEGDKKVDVIFTPDMWEKNPFEMSTPERKERGVTIMDTYLKNPLQDKSLGAPMTDDGWRRHIPSEGATR